MADAQGEKPGRAHGAQDGNGGAGQGADEGESRTCTACGRRCVGLGSEIGLEGEGAEACVECGRRYHRICRRNGDNRSQSWRPEDVLRAVRVCRRSAGGESCAGECRDCPDAAPDEGPAGKDTAVVGLQENEVERFASETFELFRGPGRSETTFVDLRGETARAERDGLAAPARCFKPEVVVQEREGTGDLEWIVCSQRRECEAPCPVGWHGLAFRDEGDVGGEIRPCLGAARANLKPLAAVLADVTFYLHEGLESAAEDGDETSDEELKWVEEATGGLRGCISDLMQAVETQAQRIRIDRRRRVGVAG